MARSRPGVIPAAFLRDAVLIGDDIRKGKGVTAEDLGYVQALQHQEWRNHWDDIAEGDLVASRQNFCEVLMPVIVADQTAVAGVAEAVLWSAAAAALPANFFDSPGKLVRVRATGVMTTGVTPGTLILTPRYGTSTGGTTLGAGTVSGTLAPSVTAAPWFLDTMVVCRAIGAAGSIAIFGLWESPVGFTAAPGSVECGRNAVTTVDTTVSTGGLTVGATLSNAGSSLTTRSLVIESLN